jgi:hypothetical protein
VSAGLADLGVRQGELARVVSACFDLEHDRPACSLDLKVEAEAVIAGMTCEDPAADGLEANSRSSKLSVSRIGGPSRRVATTDRLIE